MTFVDTNVFLFAVGRQHPLRAKARRFFRESFDEGRLLVTSAEVLQELLHAYVRVGRLVVLDAALELAREVTADIWSIELEDVELARGLVESRRGLSARDLLHLACCLRRGAKELKTFDTALAAAFGA